MIKQLEKEFVGRGEVRGFKFKQLDARSSGFIYEVNANGVRYYEVFRRRINKRFATVSYPTAKSFGVWAWWCKSYDDAVKKLNAL